MTEFRRMDIREFREAGYLQEVNRQFLHPLGLALEVFVEKDGAMRLGGVWDYREDPEGIYFDGDLADIKARAEAVEAIAANRRSARVDALGYWVQPVAKKSTPRDPTMLSS